MVLRRLESWQNIRHGTPSQEPVGPRLRWHGGRGLGGGGLPAAGQAGEVHGRGHGVGGLELHAPRLRRDGPREGRGVAGGRRGPARRDRGQHHGRGRAELQQEALLHAGHAAPGARADAAEARPSRQRPGGLEAAGGAVRGGLAGTAAHRAAT
eukprot:10254998-Lingulodinium_polyedra.AAC.1